MPPVYLNLRYLILLERFSHCTEDRVYQSEEGSGHDRQRLHGRLSDLPLVELRVIERKLLRYLTSLYPRSLPGVKRTLHYRSAVYPSAL